MRKTIPVIAFLALLGMPAALAQSGTSAGSSTAPASGIRQAPIGHRQPRPSEIPAESTKTGNPTNVNAEDAALDRKIKSICRGC
ncbi:MAG TPA: hypothetical protein VHC94_14895 [Nitrobacter sp.]|jgi:hypothetical protein|nr:hypothetical protein [Nitrobacter sp.]